MRRSRIQVLLTEIALHNEGPGVTMMPSVE
jgi:hypothetical protein